MLTLVSLSCFSALYLLYFFYPDPIGGETGEGFDRKVRFLQYVSSFVRTNHRFLIHGS